jgi:hypothetical protein
MSQLIYYEAEFICKVLKLVYGCWRAENGGICCMAIWGQERTFWWTALLKGDLTGQISKSGTRTPFREYNVWWSQETLCGYRLDKRRTIEIVHFRFTLTFTLSLGGPNSSVGIATDYGLDCPGIESLWRQDFSAPVHTGPGAHSAPCTVGIGSFPGVESGREVKLTPHPLLVPRSKNRVELYLYSP